MKKQILLTLSLILGLVLLYYLRYHILYPGVSKVKIVSPEGGVSAFTIPNEMVSKFMDPPVHGEVGSIALNLEPGLVWGRGPKYYITLSSNGNNNSRLRVTLPNRVASMDEVESNFMGYKKYIRDTGRGDITSFMLVAINTTDEPIFIHCAQGYMQQLKNCVYYGIYDEKLSYQFMFPGEEIEELNKLIIYAENKITDLLDKE